MLPINNVELKFQLNFLFLSTSKQKRNLQTRESSVPCLRSWTKESSSSLLVGATCHSRVSLYLSQVEEGRTVVRKLQPESQLIEFYSIIFHSSSRSYKFKTLQVSSCENYHVLQLQCSKPEGIVCWLHQTCLRTLELFQRRFWLSVPSSTSYSFYYFSTWKRPSPSWATNVYNPSKSSLNRKCAPPSEVQTDQIPRWSVCFDCLELRFLYALHY